MFGLLELIQCLRAVEIVRQMLAGIIASFALKYDWDQQEVESVYVRSSSDGSGVD